MVNESITVILDLVVFVLDFEGLRELVHSLLLGLVLLELEGSILEFREHFFELLDFVFILF